MAVISRFETNPYRRKCLAAYLMLVFFLHFKFIKGCFVQLRNHEGLNKTSNYVSHLSKSSGENLKILNSIENFISLAWKELYIQMFMQNSQILANFLMESVLLAENLFKLYSVRHC